jgi:hypothetical protein
MIFTEASRSITTTDASARSGSLHVNHTAADVNVLAFLGMAADAWISTIGISSCKLARSGSLAIDVDGVFVVNQAIGCK